MVAKLHKQLNNSRLDRLNFQKKRKQNHEFYKILYQGVESV